MKKIITIIAIQIGVDVLGFPLIHRTYKESYFIVSGKYFNAFSKC